MNYDDFENEIYGEKKVNNNYDYDYDYSDNSHINGNVLQYEELEKLVATKFRGSMLWMVLGLVTTVLVGYFFLNIAYAGLIPSQILNVIFPVSLVLELIVVFSFSALAYKANTTVLKIMFLFYSALNGITLTLLVSSYGSSEVVYALGGTVILFAILSIYGYVTKEDLTKYSTMLKVGLISLIIMGIINIFIQSDQLMWISSMLGVIIFIILIAVDVNRIKNTIMYYAVYEDQTIVDRVTIIGALNLYLDFINLFIYILRIIGRKK